MDIGKVVHPDKVVPFVPPGCEGIYTSRMLLDAFNSGSEKMQINHGVLNGGTATPGAAHPGHDEIYIVMQGEAVLNMDGDEYDIKYGSVVFIPGGTFHSLKNKSETEDFVILTVWAGRPAEGINEVYDERLKAWGTTYREIDE